MWRGAAPYLVLFAVALGIRLPYLINKRWDGWPPATPTECENVARSLARGEGMANVFSEGTGPSAHLAPLFPWALGQVYRVCDWTGVERQRGQRTLATLITCLGIALLPLLGRSARLHRAASWAAAWLLCVLPGNTYFEVSGRHEQPVLCLGVTLVLLALIRLHDLRWRSRRLIALTGLLVGLLALVGPGFLAVASLAALGECLVLAQDRRAVGLGAIVIGMICVVVLAPWAYRNRQELGGWVWTRSNFGLELRVGNNPHATGMTDYPEFDDYHPYGNPIEASLYARLGELTYMRQKGDEAREWIAAHPGRFVEITAARVLWFWFPEPSILWRGNLKWGVVPGLTFLGMLAGLACLVRRGNPYRWLFVAVIVGYFLPYLVTHIHARYRYPLCGVCMLLTCEAVVRAVIWWTVGRQGTPATIGSARQPGIAA